MSNVSMVYGVVSKGVFLSSRMERRLRRAVPDGVWQMDMGADDFEETLEPADIDDATKSFRRGCPGQSSGMISSQGNAEQWAHVGTPLRATQFLIWSSTSTLVLV